MSIERKITYIFSFIGIIFIIFGSGIKFKPATKEFKFVDEVNKDTLTITAGNAFEAQYLLYLDLPRNSFIKLVK